MLNSVSPLFKQFSKPLGTEEVDSDVGSAIKGRAKNWCFGFQHTEIMDVEI